MQINIKTSEASLEIIRRLTPKLGENIPENVIARIALAYSLQNGNKFNVNDAADSKGKEYKDHILFESQYRDFYIALICQYYGIYKTDDNIPKYIKMHIDDGLSLLDRIFERNDFTFFDFLNEYIERGTQYLVNVEISTEHVKNNNQSIEKNYFSNLIKLEIGHAIGTNEPVWLSMNDSTRYNNCHIAVAGNSGTGKTEFAKDLISQLYNKSNGHVNYIYLDFKGLKQDDIKNYENFFADTKTEFVDVPKTPFPINPLTFIDNVNEQNKNMGIDKFVDIVCKYSKLGIKQKGKLREATVDAFLEQHNGTYPTISHINEKLQELYDKQDSLTEIMNDLSRYKIFLEDKKNTSNFLNKNIYLSLSGDLPISVRFTSLFLIINYLYNVFMNMDNTPTENNIKALRYVILIDEAHVLFKERKYEEILEKMLREIRSKGVSIVLLSQGIGEYDQKGFDFSSMCEIAFLLDIKDKNNTKSINKFLGLTDKDGTKAYRSLEKIQKGQAISNIKEFPKGELFWVNQYWKRDKPQ